MRRSLWTLVVAFAAVMLITDLPHALALLHLAAQVSVPAFHQAHPHVTLAGPALEILNGFATQPNTGLAWTMAAGDSLTIRNTDPSKLVRLISAFTTQQTAGILQITSPKMHDNVRGYHAINKAAIAQQLWPFGTFQRVYPQDTLGVTQSGSNTAGDIEMGSLLVYYDDLSGINGRFIDRPTLNKRGLNLMTSKNTLALGTAGGYSGSQALNTTDDLMKANTDYALVGYTVDVLAGCVGYKGPDTGNLRVGGPCDPAQHMVTSQWFSFLSDWFGTAMIPVFNSANKAGTFIDGTQDENGADVIVTSIFVELAAQ